MKVLYTLSVVSSKSLGSNTQWYNLPSQVDITTTGGMDGKHSIEQASLP